MARTIHVSVVEVPAMSDPFAPREGGFRDLMPWADPYIAALMEKLRRQATVEGDLDRFAARDEVPPPLHTNDRPASWHADWSPRNWPRS